MLFEYGLRQAFDKPTVLIKDSKTRRIFDLSGFRDIEYDVNLRYAPLVEARARIVKAIGDTVKGHDEGGQIFSLVKLMNLTKASIPHGEVTPLEARLQIISSQIQSLATQITTPTKPFKLEPVRPIIDSKDEGGARYSYDDAKRIFDLINYIFPGIGDTSKRNNDPGASIMIRNPTSEGQPTD